MPAPSRRHWIERVDLTHGAQFALQLATVILIGLGGTVWLLPILRGVLPLGEAGRFLDGLFGLFCHRLPDRSVELGSVLMPVCSRCAGLMSGLALACIIRRPRLSSSQGWALVSLAVLLTVADVVMQERSGGVIDHVQRLATGALMGYAASLQLMVRLEQRRNHLVSDRSEPEAVNTR